MQPINGPANEQPQSAVAPAAPAAPAGTAGTITTTTSAVGTLPVDAAAKPTTFAVGGAKVTLAFPSSSAKSGSSLELSVANESRMHAQSSTSSSSNSCPFTPPTFYFKNTSRSPIVLTYADLKRAYVLVLPTSCSSVLNEGFNVALGETAPSVVQPTTIGDVIGRDIYKNIYGLTGFVPRAGASYTFAPGSTTALTFVQATSTGGGYPNPGSEVVTFPPGQPVTVGSVPNSTGGTTTISVTAADPSGGGSASVQCFSDTDPRFAADIQPQYITAFQTDAPYHNGVVKGACQFYTGSSTVDLGPTVTFTITNPDPDTAHGLLEGPIAQANCTQTTTNNVTTATCPVPNNSQGYILGGNPNTEYEYFLFGNWPDAPASNVQLNPAWVSVAAGTPSSGYTFALPTFASYPVTLKIDGDSNKNLSLAQGSGAFSCSNGGNDMTQVAPGTITINCTGHYQQVNVSYNGGAWQYDHNDYSANQNQDCDASCVAYAAIDLYDATGTKIVQGDGPGATINGTSKALATINPIAIIDPASGALEDPNGVTVNLSASGPPTTLKVTEANLNALDDTSIVFGLRQPTNGAEFGLNVYYGGSSFVTSGSPSLPVGGNQGLAHIPYGVGLDIQANALGGTGQLFITPPEPAGQHAPPSAIVQIGIPQASPASPPPASPPPIQTIRHKTP